MYHATVETTATAEKVLETFQATLLPHGFEIVERSETEISFRHGLGGIGKHSSPLTSFSEIDVSISHETVSVSASYGNLWFFSCIGAAIMLGLFVYFFVSFSDLPIGTSWTTYAPLIGLVFLPLGFRRARLELDKVVRSVSMLP